MDHPSTLPTRPLDRLLGDASAGGETGVAPGFPSLLGLGAEMERLRKDRGSREQLLDALLDETAGERIFLLEHSREEDGWEVIAARSFEGEEILHPEEKVIIPLIDPCRARGEGYFTPDLEAEEVEPSLRRGRHPRTRSLLILPFPEASRVLYIDHRFQELQLAPGAAPRLGWLFTLLVAGEERAAARAAIEELEEELRSTRRLLRERRDGIPGRARKEGGPGSGRDGEGQGRRPQGSPSIIGQHPDVLEILALIDRIAPTSAAVLITGESGTGKELIAREIHEQSPWSDAPFISENCGAITETLLEMELFGSVKGAFTGADQDRPGLFEIASGGTLFLDEIGDTSPGLQKKLLRVLQESKVRRVGGNELIPVKVRVVSATNRDLFAEVRAGNFREDLFYRLNVINIMLPALRDRREDIPLLAEHFLQQLNDESGIEKRIPPALLEALLTHSWPGNIRELQNEVRRCYALSPLELDPGNLSPRVGAPQERPGRQPFELDAVLEKGSLRAATEDLEQEVLAAALKRFRGNRAVICSKLKIPKTTLYSKLKRYGLTDE